MADTVKSDGWNVEQMYWRKNYHNRPYAHGDRQFEEYEPGYRYGYEAAHRYGDRSWEDVESDLSREWDSYPHRGRSTWQQVKDAVRDAWERVTGSR